MTPQDRDAIVDAVHSFRPGSPIVIDDVRFACAVDGHSIGHLVTHEVVSVMRTVATPDARRKGSHDRRSWRWSV